jgi:hypothetical protein
VRALKAATGRRRVQGRRQPRRRHRRASIVVGSS